MAFDILKKFNLLDFPVEFAVFCGRLFSIYLYPSVGCKLQLEIWQA